MSTSMESLEHGPQHVYTFYKFSTCFYESCGQKTTLDKVLRRGLSLIMPDREDFQIVLSQVC